MRPTAGRGFLLWLLAMAAGAVVVWNTRFVTDMSFFLPTQPTAEQRVLVDQLRDSVVSRLMMVAVEGADSSRRAAVSRELRARLAEMPEFASVRNGETGSLGSERDFLFAHRYLLSPAVTAERFSVAGLKAAIGNSVDLLSSPAAVLIKPLIARDPTGELLELLVVLGSGAQPATQDGVWVSPDGERALLMVEPRAAGSDTDGQETAIALVRAAFAESARTANALDARISLSGPGVFAVKSRATIKDDVSRLSLISALGIVGLLYYFFRSPRILALGLLPVLSGALAGIVAVGLAFGSVFGITVGFGSALIGEAVDYSIYYFVQSAPLGVQAWRARFWPTIRLGMLTSVAGFGVLVFSGFPGLAQLGLYAVSGLLVAALVTRFLLPVLAGPRLAMRDSSLLGQRLGRFFSLLPALRWPAVAAALAAGAYLAFVPGRLWHPDLSVLSTIGAQDAALDRALREDLGAPDARYLVVVRAPDREAALQGAERAGGVLDRMVEQGAIGGYETPTRLLPSRATQAQRRASLPEGEELARRLRLALADSPLSPNKLGRFVEDVEAARRAPDLDRETLAGTGLALAVDALLTQRAGTWQVVMPLLPPAGGQGGIVVSESLREGLAAAAEGALLIDMKREADSLYEGYLRQAVGLSLAGLAAILVLLGLALRSLRRLAVVMLPLGISVLVVIAALHLTGERLHLLHLVGMLLIVAVGSNYALFFSRPADSEDAGRSTVTSTLIACLTTATGFGTLALSKVPVLHALGTTVGPGAVLALLFSAAFALRRR
jgi:predicted exporter